jgi:hypothetical protein
MSSYPGSDLTKARKKMVRHKLPKQVKNEKQLPKPNQVKSAIIQYLNMKFDNTIKYDYKSFIQRHIANKAN